MWFEALQIPLAPYLPTWKGKIVESDAEMNAARVIGIKLCYISFVNNESRVVVSQGLSSI